MGRNGKDKKKYCNDIAVIGMSGRFPGARNIEEFWDNLIKGRETISFFSDKELKEAGISPVEYKNPNYVKAKGIIEDIDAFDADFFSYPPKEAERMDPQIRILHECSWEALENAGYDPDAFEGMIGCYFGANENHEWIRRVQAITANTPEFYDAFLLNYRDYIATRISYKFDLKGPSFTLLTACSTSLVAIHLACQGLMSGECHMALAGGVSLSLPQKRGYLFQEGLMVSSDGHCRTFDARADGTVFGDGAGVVVLKPLEKALFDRDNICAVVKGSAVNNDGNGKVGFTAPSVEGQTSVIDAALKAAGVRPDSVGYVEAHGTGTLLGDPIEIEALKKAFRSKRKKFCRVGSVKTNIGHINIASGISSFIKTVLSLKQGLIPPTLHFETPNPNIDFTNSPFQINTRLLKWERDGFPRRAGVSAFGFGGTNAHIVLEEAPRQRPSKKIRPKQLLLLSAKTRQALDASAARLARHLTENPHTDLADAAYTLSVGRKDFPFRRTIVCGEIEEALPALENETSFSEAVKEKPVVFMFPGQGAQYVNMGLNLYRYEPIFHEQVDRCAGILSRYLGLDIREIIYPTEQKKEEAAARIDQTEIAQPAVFTISYALAQLWKEWGVKPRVLIGHSIGECAAACLAGVMSVEDAIRMLVERGKLMQKLPPGAMLAVSLPRDELMTHLGEGLCLAAVNSPSLCVVSGPPESVGALRVELRKQGVASQYLATSHAFHSEMMEPVVRSFSRVLHDMTFKAPRIPIVSTVMADWINPEEITEPSYWARNIRQTVLFSEAVQRIQQEVDGVFLEVGPGRTLSSFVRMHFRKAGKNAALSSMKTAKEGKPDEEFLLTSLGKLWQAGVKIDWPAFYSREKRRRIPLPSYPFERKRFWIDPVKPRKNIAELQDLLDKKIQDIADWFSVPSWKRSGLPHAAQKVKKRKQCCLLFMDRCGLGKRIAKKLEEEGHEVIKLYAGERYKRGHLNSFSVNPGRASDYEAFGRDLHKMKKFPRKIIHLWNTTDDDETGSAAVRAERFQELGFLSLLLVAQVIGKENITDEIMIYVISNNLQEVSGEEKIFAEKATLLGPVKVIPQEYPNVKCCNIDVQISAASPKELHGLADQLLPELRSDIPDVIVAYRGNHRWVQSYEKVRLEKSMRTEFRIRRGGVYLITGGLGGLGLVFAEYLAKTAGAKLILTGRSRFPQKKEWDEWLASHSIRDPISRKIRSLRKLEKLGSEILVLSVDVADLSKMRRGLTRAMKIFGPVNGIIHAAGLSGEGILQLKKHETAREIFTPKIQGTIVLAEIFKNSKLDFFVLCSSIASVLGGIGLGDYCAANSFLDAFAVQHRFHQGWRIVAINWDMWGQVGMGLKTHMPDELKDWFERELRNGITTREGVDVFRRILSWPDASNVVVSTRDLQARIDLWLRRELIKQKEKNLEDASSKPRYARPNLSTEYARPETRIERKVAGIWRKLFGVEKIGRTDNFYELGGHSLLATTMLSELRKFFGANISIRDVLDNPTVSDLSALIKSSLEQTEKGASDSR